MQDIESLVMSNYHQNMLYLEQNHNDLFSKLKALEILLSDGKYPQKYDLEYKDGYFDVVELFTGEYLYKNDSNHYSKEIVNSTNFKKNEHSIRTFYNLKFKDEDVKNLKNLSANHKHSTTAPLISHYSKHIDDSSNMKKIDKFIFLGVGLGLHLKGLISKTKADSFFVVENDLELFRLSLFTCNYKELFENKTILFSVNQSFNEFNETFIYFYELGFTSNHYLKFSLFSSEHEIYIKNIQSAVLTRTENCYPHSGLLEKGKRVLSKINKGYKFLSTLKNDNEFFKDKPVLVLGAGPSLGVNKEWLVQNHDKFIIIAPFVTLRVLYDLGIAADIFVHIDENDDIAHKYLDDYKNKIDYFENSIFILSASVPEMFFDSFNKDSIYLIEDRTHYKMNNNYISDIASVGEASYAIALFLSSYDIYLLGLDLALSDLGHTHNATHISSKKVDISSHSTLKEESSLRDSVIKIRGNLRSEVYTTPLYAMSAKMMNIQTKKYLNHNQKVYNLSDGAYFENTIPLNVKDVSVEKAGLRVYGAVSAVHSFEFIGFCKDTENDGIYEVDVCIDESLVCTLKADKEIEKVKSRFDVEDHSFRFKLEDKYLDRSHLLEFKISKNSKELVNSGIKTICKTDKNFRSELFLYNLSKLVDIDKLKNLYMKDSIGFLVTEENLKDKDFVEYIKELYVRFPQVIFKAFYFSDEQKSLVEQTFCDELDRFEFLIPKNMFDIVGEIQVYIGRQLKIDSKIFQFIEEYCSNIFVAIYDADLKNTKLKEVNFSTQENIVIRNPDIFNIPSEEFENNLFINIVLKKLLENTGIVFEDVNLEMTLYENRLYKSIGYAVQSQEFIKNIFMWKLKLKSINKN